MESIRDLETKDSNRERLETLKDRIESLELLIKQPTPKTNESNS